MRFRLGWMLASGLMVCTLQTGCLLVGYDEQAIVDLDPEAGLDRSDAALDSGSPRDDAGTRGDAEPDKLDADIDAMLDARGPLDATSDAELGLDSSLADGSLDDAGSDATVDGSSGEHDGSNDGLDGALDAGVDAGESDAGESDAGDGDAGWWSDLAPTETCGAGLDCSPRCLEAASECVFDCTQANNCSTGCASETACRLDCTDGNNCDLVCGAAATCSFACGGGNNCEMGCASGAVCELDCRAANDCVAYCVAGSTCLIDCRDGQVNCDQVICEEEASCLTLCDPDNGQCRPQCPDGVALTCPDSSVACNRLCP